MVNVFLVVVAVILSLAIIAGSIYVLVYFQHPEDKLVAWVPKIVVVCFKCLFIVCFEQHQYCIHTYNIVLHRSSTI